VSGSARWLPGPALKLPGLKRGGRPGRSGRPGPGVPLLLAVSGWIVLGIVAAGAPVPIRAVAVFAFTLVCPGTAVIRLLPVRDPLERAVLAVALGLSFGALVAEFTDIGRPGQPSVVLIVLALVCTAAALAELVRGARTRA
jgi:hypothetical protein